MKGEDHVYNVISAFSDTVSRKPKDLAKGIEFACQGYTAPGGGPAVITMVVTGEPPKRTGKMPDGTVEFLQKFVVPRLDIDPAFKQKGGYNGATTIRLCKDHVLVFKRIAPLARGVKPIDL